MSSQVPGSRSKIVKSVINSVLSSASPIRQQKHDKQMHDDQKNQQMRQKSFSKQPAKHQEKQPKEGKEKARRANGERKRLRRHALLKYPEKKRKAVEVCNKYADRAISARPSAKGSKRARSITFGSDCGGLGTDAIAVQKACARMGIQMNFKFVSEADSQTRRMHSILGNFHKLKPEKTFSDLAERHHDSVDLYMSGPPCQPWTQLVKGAGVEDVAGRGTVMYHVVHFISTDKPKAFIIENVVGLFHKHAADMATILRALKAAGFQVTWSKVNALQNCSPQSRPRLYIVGIRDDCRHHAFTWPQPLTRAPSLDMFLDSEPADHLPDFNQTEERNYTMWNKKLRKVGISLDSTTFMMDLQAGRNFGQCTQYQCPCITKARGKSGGYFISSQNRYTNIYELGRLQGFSTKEVQALVSSDVPMSLVGAAFGNAMHKTVLERLVPRVLYAAGLCDEKLNDHWKKCDWKEWKGKGVLPDVMDS